MNTVNTKVLPQDYKKTEFGQIPDDWDVKRLDEVFVISAGRDLVKEDYYPIRDHTHKIPIYSNSLENGGLYGYTKSPRYEKNCVTITARGTIGKANYRDSKFDAIGRLLVLKPKLNIDCYFVSEFINNKLYFSIESTGVPQLTAPQASKYLVILPKINEQIGISKVLSDLDSLIQKTEKLVEKKRDIRKGLIHNLLSGTQRLHGFENDWVTEKLTELCWFQEGPGVRTSQFTNSGVKLLNGTNINKNQLNLDTTERYIPSKLANGAYAHFLADNDDIVIASSGISVEKFDEKVAFVEKKDLPLCMNTSTIRFKSYSNKITKEYLFYFLQSDSFKKHIGEQATGSAQLNFGPYHLNRLSVHLPKDIDEQTAIAEILSFVDSEIHLLEKKLVKYNQIKQGAMQVLLTGKIRLNPNSYAKPITQSRTN